MCMQALYEYIDVQLPTRHAVSNSACSLYSVCALVIIALRIQAAAALFIILAAYIACSPI